MAGRGSTAALVGSLMFTFALAGCGGGGQRAKTIPNEDLTAKQIYSRAEYALEGRHDPKTAAKDFGEVQRLYPYSAWAKRATIMEAYADHQAKKYQESRDAAQRYLDYYPGDEDAAYAQYLLALSYYDQIDAVGRDQGVTFQALKALRDVIQKYPNSDYARSAMLKFDLAFNHLAAKEMEIGRYYEKKGDYAAAANRFRAVVEQYQTTTYTPEALERLVECYIALGFTDDAQTAGAILGHNFRSSPFYQEAYVRLKHNGLAPSAKTGSWLNRIFDNGAKSGK
ncbi:outer membrane protein assembly factor BamD [Solirhodobacter olei]|uniref:outer membrane protein assembly factor BamD n=1 Tax=Solirhodobacter olei TaxID=2493082 RepID=UPI000FDC0D63|nr:outer membrane protein assembly factor BamD [Solirhodobacter olei]